MSTDLAKAVATMGNENKENKQADIIVFYPMVC